MSVMPIRQKPGWPLMQALRFLDAARVELPKLTRQQLHILLAVAAAGEEGLCQTDIMDLTGLEDGVVWPVWKSVSRLEHMDLVARVVSEKDRYKLMVFLTLYGSKMLHRVEGMSVEGRMSTQYVAYHSTGKEPSTLTELCRGDRESISIYVATTRPEVEGEIVDMMPAAEWDELMREEK